EYSDDELAHLFSNDCVDPQWEAVAGEGAHSLCRMMGIGARPVPVPGPIASPVRRTSPTSAPQQPQPSPAAATPRVSIIVLTALGPKHLPECLDSLRQLDYPQDSIEVIVVDNGSKEDPTATALRHYPSARV